MFAQKNGRMGTMRFHAPHELLQPPPAWDFRRRSPGRLRDRGFDLQQALFAAEGSGKKQQVNPTFDN